MKILFASTPASGHINPMFAIGQMLVAAGHEVVGLSAIAMRDRIEAVGATFRAFRKTRILIYETSLLCIPNSRTFLQGSKCLCSIVNVC